MAPFFLDSCEGAGIRLTEDFNKPGGREGAGYYNFAVRDGVRDSAARAMLGDIVMGRDVRTNLDIMTGTHVSKVLIEDAQPVRRRTVFSIPHIPGHGRNVPSHLAGKLSSHFCRPFVMKWWSGVDEREPQMHGGCARALLSIFWKPGAQKLRRRVSVLPLAERLT